MGDMIFIVLGGDIRGMFDFWWLKFCWFFCKFRENKKLKFEKLFCNNEVFEGKIWNEVNKMKMVLFFCLVLIFWVVKLLLLCKWLILYRMGIVRVNI